MNPNKKPRVLCNLQNINAYQRVIIIYRLLNIVLYFKNNRFFCKPIPNFS